MEYTGKNVEEAIKEGLKSLGVKKEDVEIEILDEGKSGLFGLMGSTPARVKITLREGVKVSRSVERAKVELETAKKAEEMLEKIIKLMGFEAKLSSEVSNNRAVVNVACDESAILIGKGGQTMKALEYLLRLAVSRQAGQSVNVSINVNGYLDKKYEKIVKKAKEIEEKVKETKEPVTIKLPSDERRVIHVTLKNSPDVETVSEGEGENRVLIVRPKKAQ